MAINNKAWNTNFTYGEYLTSSNMNSSSVGYLYPGVYNADMYFDVTTTNTSSVLTLNVLKGTTFVFSHNHDVSNDTNDIEMDLNSYDTVSKCVAIKDSSVSMYNSSTDSTITGIKNLLNSEIIYVYAAKKIVSVIDDSDSTPIFGMFSFYLDNSTVKRYEFAVPNTVRIDTSSQSTNVYYNIIGVLLKLPSSPDTFFSGNILSADWAKYHTFVSRCLPEYNRNGSVDTIYSKSDIYYQIDSNTIKCGVSWEEAFINNVIFNNKKDWKEIYKWKNTNISNISLISVDPIIDSEKEKIAIDFIYGVFNSEQSGNINIETELFNNNTTINLQKLHFITDDTDTNEVKNFIKSRNMLASYTPSSGTTKKILYIDNSISNINRFINLFSNKNILPKLYNYIRYTNGTSSGDTIIPIAISLRYVSSNDNNYYSNDFGIDPNNTLCLFDLYNGNYNLNTCIQYFQTADIISALPDDTIA